MWFMPIVSIPQEDRPVIFQIPGLPGLQTGIKSSLGNLVRTSYKADNWKEGSRYHSVVKSTCPPYTWPQAQSLLKIQPLRKHLYKKYAESILGKYMKGMKENISKYI